jgi:hypothetical protein
MFKLKTIKQAIQAQGAKPKPQSILVYGEAKVGKTRKVADELTAAGFNVLWLDVENGGQTLMQLPDEQLDRITYIKVPDTATNPVGIVTVGRMLSAKQPLKVCAAHGAVNCTDKGCAAPEAYFTFDPSKMDESWVLVVDSLTQLTDSAMARVKQDGDVFVKGVTKAGYDEFGAQGALLTNVLSHMQQAPYHRVFISHAEIVEEATGGEKIYPVCGTRALSAKSARFFDHVVYLFRLNNQHKATSSTTYKHNVMAGSRSDVDVANASIVDMLRGTKPQPAVDTAPVKSGSVAAAMLKR